MYTSLHISGNGNIVFGDNQDSMASIYVKKSHSDELNKSLCLSVSTQHGYCDFRIHIYDQEIVTFLDSDNFIEKHKRNENMFTNIISVIDFVNSTDNTDGVILPLPYFNTLSLLVDNVCGYTENRYKVGRYFSSAIKNNT